LKPFATVATALRRSKVEFGWGGFCLANIAAMVVWPRWETIPFHFIWTSLSILYGFRVWSPKSTLLTLLAICVSTGTLILADAADGYQEWGELFEVPLMSMMFLAMVWHARRRQAAMDAVASEARERAELLERQEQFLHDISHELRTPLTIARGNVEALACANGGTPPEAAVALDELDRLGRLVEQLLALAKASNIATVTTTMLLDDLLEDVVMRWAGVALRVWRVGEPCGAQLEADPDALRIALDALIENAVEHTAAADMIEVSGSLLRDEVVIQVSDAGTGMAPEALDRIFERFARAGSSTDRAQRGVGLGLAIVAAVANSHGGSCTVESSSHGSVFALHLPRAAPAARAVVLEDAAALQLSRSGTLAQET
jgi:signal transduction histidine kinase